jgi:RHS repeat-associated protein
LKGNFHDQFLGEGGTATCPLLPDMWGEVTQTVGTLSADFQYAGYYAHGPSGLNLTTFRAYDPTLGRWINRDRLGELVSINLYFYGENNPVRYTDPSGLDVVVLYDPKAVGGLTGHCAVLIGHDSDDPDVPSWNYYDKTPFGPNTPTSFSSLKMAYKKMPEYSPDNSAQFPSDAGGDSAATGAAQASQRKGWSPKDNCSDLCRAALGGIDINIPPGEPWTTPKGVFDAAKAAGGSTPTP